MLTVSGQSFFEHVTLSLPSHRSYPFILYLIETHSSRCYKHVLYFHVNTNNHYSSCHSVPNILSVTRYTPEHCPQNPDKLTDIIQQSQRNISITFHTMSAWAVLQENLLILGLSTAEWHHVHSRRPSSLSFKDIVAWRYGFERRKWRVLLPFTFAIWKQWLPVWCLLGSRWKMKSNSRRVYFLSLSTSCISSVQ